MTKPMIAALAIMLAAAAPPASHAARMQGMAMGQASSKTGSAVGVVTAVDAKAGTVTIRHEPIPTVGWPAMTMAFRATTPSVLHAAKVGGKVAFGVRVTGAKAEVTSLTPL